MSAWLDSDIGAIAHTTQFGVEQWLQAHAYIGEVFELEHRDVIWLLVVRRATAQPIAARAGARRRPGE